MAEDRDVHVLVRACGPCWALIFVSMLARFVHGDEGVCRWALRARVIIFVYGACVLTVCSLSVAPWCGYGAVKDDCWGLVLGARLETSGVVGGLEKAGSSQSLRRKM